MLLRMTGWWMLLLMVAVPSIVKADDVGVRAVLSLRDGKTTYLSGEAIVLDLAIESAEPIVIEQTSPAYAFSLDTVVFASNRGLYPWRTDQERFVGRFASDALVLYPPVTTFKVGVPLGSRVRFDEPGTYTVHVVTRRVKPVVTTNDVTFTVALPDEATARQRAERIDAALRAAKTEREQERLANELDLLPDDAATAVKLALLTGPTGRLRYMRHDTTALWIARDREAVIHRLEEAIVDPQQDFPMGSTILGTLVTLKASLVIPFDPDAKDQPHASGGMVYQPGPFDATTSRVRADYLHRIAASLPMRTGKSLVDAAQRILWAKDRSSLPDDDPDLAAAREALITHFDDVNEYNVDVALNGYAERFLDPRMIPALHRIVDAPHGSVRASSRPYALALLAELEPDFVASLVVRDGCSDQPLPMNVVVRLPMQTLPALDDCLEAKVAAVLEHAAPDPLPPSLDTFTMPYVARFATARLLPVVERLYLRIGDAAGHGAAKGAALVYLMRWQPERYRAWLETAAPGPGNAVLSWAGMTAVAYPPTTGLRTYFRDRARTLPLADARTYVYALGEIGEPEDRVFLEKQLAALRTSTSPPHVASKEEAQMEAALATS